MYVYVVSRLLPSEAGGYEEIIGARKTFKAAKLAPNSVARHPPVDLDWISNGPVAFHALDQPNGRRWSAYHRSGGIHYIIRRLTVKD